MKSTKKVKQFIKQMNCITLSGILLFNSSFTSITAGSTQKISSGGGGSAISDIADGMVDLFTGDFKYSVPLMTVPGPNGENVPISANYAGGIRTNQKASWLGLGWDYNPGEIARSVVSYPDDYNGEPIYSSKNNAFNFPNSFSPNSFEKTFCFGVFNSAGLNNPSLNYNDFPLTNPNNDYNNLVSKPSGNINLSNNILLKKGFDLYSSETYQPESKINKYKHSDYANTIPCNYSRPRTFQKLSVPYNMPGYDQYYVSGPGIYGKIKPLMLSAWFNLITSKQANFTSFHALTNKPVQFYFENSTYKNVNSTPDYPSTNYIKSGYYVKYYTNGALNSSTNLFDNSSKIGALDFRIVSSGQRRPTNEFPSSGIGAIQITTPQGLTYHYSLPVYNFNEIQRTYKNATFPNDLALHPVITNGVIQSVNFDETIRKEKYASTWKLTAVTGQDYSDLNGNKIVDEGDEGYWIAYDYKKYTDDFLTTSNYFNYNHYYNPKITPFQFLRQYQGYVSPTFSKVYNNSTAQKQIYYLDKISTATHSAYFIKSYRNDNLSYDRIFYSNQTLSKPELKLDRIILLKNEDKSVIESVVNPSNSSPNSYHPNFNNNGTNLASLYSNYKYAANQTNINSKSLSQVVFKTDYSLCKRYYENIYSTFVYENLFFNNPDYMSINNNSSFVMALFDKQPNHCNAISNLNQSGKLTLNEIEFLDDNGSKNIPSITFDYKANNSFDNPNYEHDKYDYWGFYKSDLNDVLCSNYPTPTSATQMHAWSLKEITTPNNIKYKIEYEPDSYVREGFADDPGGAGTLENGTIGKPKQIYAIHKLPLNFSIGTFASGNQQGNMNLSNSYVYDNAVDLQLTNSDAHVVGPACSSTINSGNGAINTVNAANILRSRIFVPLRHSCSGYNFLCTLDGYINNGYVIGTPYNTSSNQIITSFSPTQVTSNYSIFAPNYKQLYYLTISHSQGGSLAQWGWSQGIGSNCKYPGLQLYDRTEYTGYVQNKYRELYGGGIRVKTIKVENPLANESYTKKITYKDGYCPLVNIPFALGFDLKETKNALYINYNSYFPYNNISNVGYTTVETENINLNGNSNGKMQYLFQNYGNATSFTDTRNYNPISVYTNDIANKITGNVYQASCIQSNFNSVWKFGYDMYAQSYVIYSDQFQKLRGKLIRATVRDVANNLKTETINFYDDKVIEENFSNPEFQLDYSHYHQTAVASNTVVYSQQCGPSPNLPVPNAPNSEHYKYGAIIKTHNVVLSKTITKTYEDNIAAPLEVETSYFYDPHTADVYKTETKSNGETIVSLKTYAYNQTNSVYQNNNPNILLSGDVMGFKCENPYYSNLVTAPYTIRTLKQIGQPVDFLMSETKFLTGRDLPTYSANSASGLGTYVVLNNTTYNHKAYVPGSVKYSALINDNNVSPTQPLTYILDTKLEALNKAGAPLEVTNNKGRIASSKYYPITQNGLISAANCKYGSFTFCSFEEEYNVNPSVKLFEGEVNSGNLKTALETASNGTIIKPHTGNYFVKVNPTSNPNANTAPIYNTYSFDNNRTYTAKVWVHKLSAPNSKLFVKFSTGYYKEILKSDPSNIQVGDWVLMNLEFFVPSTLVSTGTSSGNSIQVGVTSPTGANSGIAYFDDLVFHPVDAVVNGNVFDKRTNRLIATLDNENFATTYNYDAAGRVTSTYVETVGYAFKKVAEVSYNNCQTFTNNFLNNNNMLTN